MMMTEGFARCESSRKAEENESPEGGPPGIRLAVLVWPRARCPLGKDFAGREIRYNRKKQRTEECEKDDEQDTTDSPCVLLTPRSSVLPSWQGLGRSRSCLPRELHLFSEDPTTCQPGEGNSQKRGHPLHSPSLEEEKQDPRTQNKSLKVTE
uniref:Uncharacterized protein n=1 Tax=Molossus molossus TaxID=27622 RepID=A0A7J8DTP7_MOLMO|nr:hypothetical protein HJG59_009189 [Molossus molossus]